MRCSFISRHTIHTKDQLWCYWLHDFFLAGFLCGLFFHNWLFHTSVIGLIGTGVGLIYRLRLNKTIFISYGISFTTHYITMTAIQPRSALGISIHSLSLASSLWNNRFMVRRRLYDFMGVLWHVPFLHVLSLWRPETVRYNFLLLSILGTLYSIVEDKFWFNWGFSLAQRIGIYQLPLLGYLILSASNL